MSETHGNPSHAHGSHAHGVPPPPPEPKTPMWLPALGAALFLTVGLIWGLMPSSSSDSGAAPAGSATPTDAGAGAPR